MSIEQIRLLLIEKDLSETRLIVNRLEAATDVVFLVESVDCLEAALERLPHGELDVVLLDLLLPDSQGIDALARIRAQAPGLPIVVLTEDNGKNIARKALTWGASDYVSKGLIASHVLEHALCHAVERGLVRREAGFSEDYFRALVENAPVAILILDDQGKICYSTPSMQSILGYDQADTIGKFVFELFSPDDLPQVMNSFVRLLEHPGSTDSVLVHAIHKDGPLHYVQVVGTNHLQTSGLGSVLVNLHDLSDLRQTEEALRESEQRFRLIAEQITDVFWTADLNMKMTYVSPSVLSQRGYTVEEAMAQRLEEIASPEGAELVSKILAEVHASESLENADPCQWHTAQVETYCKDGSKIWVEVSMSVLLDSDGQPAGIMGVTRDITERRFVEEDLKEIEKRYRAIFDNPLSMVLIHDENGVIIEANDTALKRCGYAREDIGKVSLQDLVHPEDALVAVQAVLEGMTKGYMSKPIQLRVIAQSGEIFWVEEIGFPLRQDGKNYRGLAIAYEITDRRKAEEELREIEKRHRALIENSSDAIAIADRDGTVLYESPSVERILGYKPEELVGRNFVELLHPNDQQGAFDPLSDFFLHPGMVMTQVFRFRHKDGSWRVIESTVKNMLEEPNVRGFVANFRDVTERKEGEEALARYAAELSRSNAELEQFAFMASHHLQEPLRLMRLYVQLFAKRYQGKLDADADEFIKYVVDGARRMQSLVDGLLAYSLVATPPKEFGAVHCEEALAHALESIQSMIEESGAVVTHDPLPTVVGDEAQIVQLFKNLISNAIKFRGERSPDIHISAVEKDGRWEFSVRDNGIGIEPEYADRIFVIFRRLHSEEEYPGTGVGLTLCRKIVERHDGRIWVESQAGQGATFHFTIPASGVERR